MRVQQRRSPCNCYPSSGYPLVSQPTPARIAFSITHGEEVRDTGQQLRASPWCHKSVLNTLFFVLSHSLLRDFK